MFTFPAATSVTKETSIIVTKLKIFSYERSNEKKNIKAEA